MEHGAGQVVIVNPAGVAVIVRLKTLAAGMEHGHHGIITIPAGVTVKPAGAGIIVPSSNNGVHSDDEQRAGRWSRPSVCRGGGIQSLLDFG